MELHEPSGNGNNMHSTAKDTETCANCKNLRLELSKLRKLISPDDEKVPDELWRQFPPKGQYLKNILLYSGYETYDAVMKLTDDAEWTEVFSFVKGLSDTMDEREKKELFGIFYKNPEKLAVLPGLKPVVSRFVDGVTKLKTLSTISGPQSVKRENDETVGSDEKLSPNSIVPLLEIIEIVTTKLCNWIRSHKNFQKNFATLKENTEKPDLIPENTFSLTPSAPLGVIFTCEVCKTTVILQRKTSGSLILSNPHRHMSQRCWLQDDYSGKLPPRSNNIKGLFSECISGTKRTRGTNVKSLLSKRKKSGISYNDNNDDSERELMMNSSICSEQGNDSHSPPAHYGLHRSATPTTTSASASGIRYSASAFTAAGTEDDLSLPSQAVSSCFADVQYPITVIITEEDE